jgi:hypothetical protein
MHDDDLHKAGFSNSEPAEDAPKDVHPDVDPPEELEPGFSNSKAVRGDSAPSEAPAQPAVEQAKSADDQSADEPAKKTTTKKAAAKKSAKKG